MGREQAEAGETIEDETGRAEPGGWTARRLALLGVGVALVAGGISAVGQAASSGRVEAIATLALDEREVGWPFYGAAQEKAVAYFGDDELVAELAADLGISADASLELRLPGDLSLLQVVAGADDEATARSLADGATESLLAWSTAEQRSLLDDELAIAADRVADLDAAVDGLRADLATATDDDRIEIEAELDRRTTERTDAQLALEDVERTIEATGAEFRVIDPAEIVPRRATTLVTAAATGLGAGAAAVFVVPLLSRRDP